MVKSHKEKIVFIINPISGTRDKSSWPDTIQKVIDKDRYDVAVVFTERAGHAFEMAKQQIKSGVMRIVAVGGDGTVNEVAMALRDSPAAMGIVPCGSGNGLARHLHIPVDLTRSLELLNQAEIIRIDYGIVNQQPFFCTFGAGFDAHIGNVFASSKKRGLVTYVSLILKEFLSYRSKKYKINVDGEKIKTRAIVVTIANSGQYGNNAYISPTADITDGELDVCIIRPFPKILAGGLAFRLLGKNIHKSRYYRSRRGKKITIKRKHKGDVHLDGEPHQMGKKLKVEIVHHGLRVMIPKQENHI